MFVLSSLRESAGRLAGVSLIGLLWLAVLGCSLTSASGTSLPGDFINPVNPNDESEPVINAPGEYRFTYKCIPVMDLLSDMIEIPGAPGVPPNFIPDIRMAMLTVCITGVTVRADNKMQFDVGYTLAPMEGEDKEVWRESDRENRNIFLKDDLGGRYEFLEVGGCAAEEMRTKNEDLQCAGWFLFPPAQPGAKSFDFHYSTADSTGESTPSIIEDIVLNDPE